MYITDIHTNTLARCFIVQELQKCNKTYLSSQRSCSLKEGGPHEPTTAIPSVNAVMGQVLPRRGCSALWGSERVGRDTAQRILLELTRSPLTVLQNSSFATVLQKLLEITWIDGQATSVNPETDVKFQNGHSEWRTIQKVKSDYKVGRF